MKSNIFEHCCNPLLPEELGGGCIGVMEERKDKILRDVHVLLERRGWSQQKLAEMTNLQRSHLTNILSGKQNPSDATLDRLEQILLDEFRPMERLPDVLEWYRKLSEYQKELAIKTLAEMSGYRIKPPAGASALETELDKEVKKRPDSGESRGRSSA